MNSNKFEELEERGELLEVIKSPDSYFALFVGILIVGFFVVMPIVAIVKIKALPVAILFCIAVIKVVKDIMKKIYIYDKCIVIGKDRINYKDIKLVEFEMQEYIRAPISYGENKTERFLIIEALNSHVFLSSNYSIKQLRKVIKYIEEYADCDVQNAYKFLEEAEIKEKRDLIIGVTVMIVAAIIVYLVIKFHFIPLFQRYD